MSSPALISSTLLVPAGDAMHSTPARGGQLLADEANIILLAQRGAVGEAMLATSLMTCTQVTR
ncbi:MAG: hypothetical protein ABTQ32_25720 [Myxococcaceae bacterium]